MATPSWLTYSNSGAIRNQPISPDLVRAMSFLPELGVTMDVYSGGETEDRRASNSGRHLHGNAADVMFYRDGRMLDWNNQSDIQILSDIVSRARANGVTGIGAGNDYMGPGRVHIGFGPEAVWGAGGRSANADEWLRNAFYAPVSARPSALQAINTAAAPQAVPRRPQGIGFAPSPPQRTGGISGLVAYLGNFARNVAAGVQSAVPPRQDIINAFINQGVRNFWSNPDMRPTVSQSGAYPVQTVSNQGTGISGLNFGSTSTAWGEDPAERNIRMANSDAIRAVTGSGAITQDAINQALSSGATLVRRI